MTKYQLTFAATTFATVTIEADDLDEAIEAAYDELPPTDAPTGWRFDEDALP